MQNSAAWRPVGVEHREYVLVRVPVVDDERLVEPVGERDVRRERTPLRLDTGRTGAVVVESGLADGAHLGGRAREPLDLGEPRIELAEVRQLGRFVRVDGHPGHDGVVLQRSLHCPGGPGQITADLHDPRHSDLGGQRQRLRRVEPTEPVLDVQMAVVVDHRRRERLRNRWSRRVPALAELRVDA